MLDPIKGCLFIRLLLAFIGVMRDYFWPSPGSSKTTSSVLCNEILSLVLCWTKVDLFSKIFYDVNNFELLLEILVDSDCLIYRSYEVLSCEIFAFLCFYYSKSNRCFCRLFSDVSNFWYFSILSFYLFIFFGDSELEISVLKKYLKGRYHLFFGWSVPEITTEFYKFILWGYSIKSI